MKKDKKVSFKKHIPLVILTIVIIYFMHNISKIEKGGLLWEKKIKK